MAVHYSSDKFVKLGSCCNDFLSSCMGVRLLGKEGLRDLVGCPLDDCLELGFQSRTLLVHLLENIEPLQNDLEVTPLFKSTLSHVKD